MPSIVETSPYAVWTGDRTIASLGTNDGADPIAFQKWHNFKEAFAPELIRDAVKTSAIEVRRCLDPFGGSGTTALTCQMLGIHSKTVEVNPFLADVIAAKLHRYRTDGLIAALSAIRVRTRRHAANFDSDHLPRTFVEPGVKGRWIFDRGDFDRICTLRSAIDDTVGPESPEARFFRVILGGMLADVSNVVISGKGRRYRRNWADRAKPDVYQLFAARADAAIRDVVKFAHRPIVQTEVVLGDARSLALDGPFDLSVFSPPYPNSFDYTDVYNLQLWMLGYLDSWDDNRELRTSTLTSHVQILREFDAAPSGSPELSQVLTDLDAVRENLWNRQIPEMVGAYFYDLATVLDSVLAALRPGAQCWMVVGDSQYRDVSVPVAKIVSQLLQERNVQAVSFEPIRHMRSSAQQGFEVALAESLVKVVR